MVAGAGARSLTEVDGWLRYDHDPGGEPIASRSAYCGFEFGSLLTVDYRDGSNEPAYVESGLSIPGLERGEIRPDLEMGFPRPSVYALQGALAAMEKRRSGTLTQDALLCRSQLESGLPPSRSFGQIPTLQGCGQVVRHRVSKEAELLFGRGRRLKQIRIVQAGLHNLVDGYPVVISAHSQMIPDERCVDIRICRCEDGYARPTLPPIG